MQRLFLIQKNVFYAATVLAWQDICFYWIANPISSNLITHGEQKYSVSFDCQSLVYNI